MATIPASDPPLDIREQIARIDRMQAELGKVQVEIAKMTAETTKITAETTKLAVDTQKVRVEARIAPWATVFTGLGAGAALFAAGIAFARLFIG